MVIKKTYTILILINDTNEEPATNIRSEGYLVESIPNTKQALEKTNTEKVNLILIDDTFLDMHSCETDFILKLKEIYPRVPIVIMITPEMEKTSIIHELLGSGNIEHCIFKPFLPQSLTSLITNIITKNQRKLERTKSAVSDSSSVIERRKFVRSNVPVDVYYYFIDKSQQKPVIIEQRAKSKDVSIEGIRLDIAMEIPKYLDLKLVLPPEESIYITGQVIWEKENIPNNTKSVGINFVDMKPQDRQLVSDYITAE